MGRSESVVLHRTVDYIRKHLDEEKELLEKIRSLGGDLEAFEQPATVPLKHE